MRAIKDNKSYDIDPSRKDAYAKQGFDIYNDDGLLACYATTKTLKYNEHVVAIKAKDDKITKLYKTIEAKDAEIAELQETIKTKDAEISKLKKGNK